jgi:hypothetical protein
MLKPRNRHFRKIFHVQSKITTDDGTFYKKLVTKFLNLMVWKNKTSLSQDILQKEIINIL